KHLRLDCSDVLLYLFSFSQPPPTAVYTLSLHDALPIFLARAPAAFRPHHARRDAGLVDVETTAARIHDLHRTVLSTAAAGRSQEDRKSTRLNSSHSQISYAVFCLKDIHMSSLPDLVLRL